MWRKRGDLAQRNLLRHVLLPLPLCSVCAWCCEAHAGWLHRSRQAGIGACANTECKAELECPRRLACVQARACICAVLRGRMKGGKHTHAMQPAHACRQPSRGAGGQAGEGSLLGRQGGSLHNGSWQPHTPPRAVATYPFLHEGATHLGSVFRNDMACVACAAAGPTPSPQASSPYTFEMMWDGGEGARGSSWIKKSKASHPPPPDVSRLL